MDECAVVVKKGSIFEKKRPWEAMGHFLYSRPTVRPVVIVPRQKDVQESSDSDSEDKETHSTTYSYYVECPVCKKAILLKSLAAHCVLHTEERPFACTSCDADFTSRPTAIMHVRDNHPGQKDTGYTVKKGSIFNMTRPWEAMGFTTLQRTSKPLKKKKKRREVPDEKRIAEDVAKIKKYLLLAENFECPVCLKAFGSHYRLLMHSVVHTKERPYRCIFCNKDFSHRDTTLTHIREVHPEQLGVDGVAVNKDTLFARQLKFIDRKWQREEKKKQMWCQICNKKFRIKEKLDQHIKHYHGGMTGSGAHYS